jgi:hypothetical protein
MKRALFAVFAAALAAGCVTDQRFRKEYGVGQVLTQSQRRGFAAKLAEQLAAAKAGTRIPFREFSDLDYVADTDSVINKDGMTVWQGRIADAGFWGTAIAVVNGHEVVGSIQVDDRVYAIRTKDDDLVVSEVDQSTFPEELDPRPRGGETRPAVIGPRASEEAPVVLRVLLVIPPSLSKWCSPPMSRLIAKMSEANVDGVWSRFTGGAVTSEMSVYCTDHEADSTNLYANLDWVSTDADVQAQRAATKSNMVAFIIPEASSCGQSFGNYPVDDPQASTRAFSVVRFDCAWENYSLAHELGHQLAMDHDRYTIKGGYTDRCNYGYSFIRDGKPVARDVMAYSGYCKSLGIDCPRIGTYSFATTLKDLRLGVPCSVTGDTDPVTGAASAVDQLLIAAPVAATWH